MDTQKALLAIIFSFIILFGYQYFFVKPSPEQTGTPTLTEKTASDTGPAATPESAAAPPVAEETAASPLAPTDNTEPVPAGRDILVDTDLYTLIVTEDGGGVKSFKLKKQRETSDPDSGYKELIKTQKYRELPLFFSWGTEPRQTKTALFTADRASIIAGGQKQRNTLNMKASLPAGLEITRSMTFNNDNYIIGLTIDVRNTSPRPLQGAPYLSLTNRPFAEANKATRFLFNGSALLIDDKLQEIKAKNIEEEGKTFKGRISWLAYEGTYFMCGIMPAKNTEVIARLSLSDTDKVTSVLSGRQDVIPAQGHMQYQYNIYFGPKKLTELKKAGADLDKIVNFGWFDVVAKPTLYILNFFYRYINNYGVAIILVTILFKLLFWPISQKGMKSMKNMQSLQPKIAKLREKYKSDPTRLNQEMMALYKTYKVNPLGGCLPMVLQIPVFFALYKVLLQAIELRHAPFMLWINDLSAPDRLWAGLHIPYLGGIPVLTLLMGGSMFLQQKMSPTSADPTQAKIMLFLPVVFTFMFLNFASGLVLYWFLNNLLSIAQQYMINRPAKTKPI